MQTALLAAAVLLLAMIVVMLLRGRGAGDAALLQQVLALQRRLDGLVAAQERVPRALAEGSAAQAKSLADVGERLARLDEATRRLEMMGRTVAEVQELLRVPKLRGTLGELWLEELLRQVFPESLYRLQHAFRSGERVDAVLRVGERLVPIDAKFPLEACQRMLAADGDEALRERRAFRRSLKERVDEIADRYIRPDEGTYDFAFMYVPAENVYYEAVVRGETLEDGRSLLGYALDRRVVPVSPNTFYAYLAAVLHGLRGLEVETRAREILDALGGLRQEVQRFARAYELVGRHLDNAGKQYEESSRQLAAIDERLEQITAVGGEGAVPEAGTGSGELTGA